MTVRTELGKKIKLNVGRKKADSGRCHVEGKGASSLSIIFYQNYLAKFFFFLPLFVMSIMNLW